MKKLLIILVITVTALSASAQRFHPGGRGGHYVSRPHVVVRAGVYAPFNPYYGYPFYPYPSYYGYERPTKLDLKIEDIKNDYQDKIWSVKHNESLSRKEKRRTVHQLRYERDQAIIQAKKDYYRPRR